MIDHEFWKWSSVSSFLSYVFHCNMSPLPFCFPFSSTCSFFTSHRFLTPFHYRDILYFYDIAFIDRLLLFSLECLALPKLNLQFLTLHDYLLRNHNLFQLESTCEYSSIATALLASHTTFSTLMITVQSLLTSTFNLNHSLATSNSI